MSKLSRKLPLMAVVAAALSNVIGGGINVLIVDVQNAVMGIGSLVPLAVLVGGGIAFFIALMYSSLSTAMPRAGGGYIYISRGLNPFFGFVAAFLKWSGTVIAMGTVAYMDIVILLAAFHHLGWLQAEAALGTTTGMIVGVLAIIWTFWLVNYFGVRAYAKTVVALAAIMIAGGAAIMFTGFVHTPQEFASATGASIPPIAQTSSVWVFAQAVAVLFWAYVGFTSISQAGGEIKDPKKNLPRAFIISSLLVTIYYFLYSTAFYHAVPWQYIVGQSNLNVPLLIGTFFPPMFAFLISIIIFVSLSNDLPPMLYTKSRLFYSWAKDGIVPKSFEKLNKHKAPVHSLTIVAAAASLVAIESVLGGFFTEVNVVVISRFIVYILMAFSMIMLKKKNRKIYGKLSFMKSRNAQLAVAMIVVLFSAALTAVLVELDLSSGRLWWKMATFQSLAIILIGAVIYGIYVRKMKAQKKDYRKIFEKLPPG